MDHVERIGAVDALVLFPVAGVGAGQAAQHHQPRHEAWIGVRFAGDDKLVYLIGAGEVVNCLGRSVAEHLHRSTQAAERFPDGNQPGALTLRALFSHVPQTKQGHYRRLFPIRPLWNRHHRKRREDAVAGVHFQGHGAEQPLPHRIAAHRPCEVGRIGAGERLVDEPG